jgi:hypothetical protein
MEVMTVREAADYLNCHYATLFSAYPARANHMLQGRWMLAAPEIRDRRVDNEERMCANALPAQTQT